jgi:hypothetical protein
MLSLFTLSLEGYSVQSLSPSPRPSSLGARRLPQPGRGIGVHRERLGAFRSLPSSFNVKRSTACPEGRREGRRVDSLSPRSPHQYHSMGLTFPLFSYSYAFFCTAKDPNSFHFISFRTLCTKHPGWGMPCSAASVHGACPDLIEVLKSTRAPAPPDPSGTSHRPFVYPPCEEGRREPRNAPIPFKIRTYTKSIRNLFRIRTSKTKDLKPCRMNTYTQTGEGAHPFKDKTRPPLASQRLSVWSFVASLPHGLFTSSLPWNKSPAPTSSLQREVNR